MTAETTEALALRQTLSLRQALVATTKTVNIQISTEDLQELKANDYKLCFAKKVGSEYNVVWQSYFKYLVTNSFSWTPQYQLFGSNQFQSEVTVKVATNLVAIGLGEQSVLDTAGVLGPASTGGPSTGITMINNYGSIHPGVNQASQGIDGKMVSTPIYVATKGIVSGTTTLTPIEMVMVWFEQNIETSTMFSTSRANAVEINLTSVDDATRLYANQKWSTPG